MMQLAVLMLQALQLQRDLAPLSLQLIDLPALSLAYPVREWPWRARLHELLGATHVEVQEVCRAGAPAWL